MDDLMDFRFEKMADMSRPRLSKVTYEEVPG